MIEEIEAQIRQRMDVLAGQDPICNRLMGRLDIIREQEKSGKAGPSEHQGLSYCSLCVPQPRCGNCV